MKVFITMEEAPAKKLLKLLRICRDNSNNNSFMNSPAFVDLIALLEKRLHSKKRVVWRCIICGKDTAGAKHKGFTAMYPRKHQGQFGDSEECSGVECPAMRIEVVKP